MDVQLAALRPHPENYNGHDDDQLRRLMASLERFGQAKDIVIWSPAGFDTAQTPTQPAGRAGFDTAQTPTQPAEGRWWYTIAGHGLVEAARRLGWPALRATDKTLDWTADEARAYLAADNELARLADPDEAALAALAASLKDVDAQLAALAAGSEERLRELLATLEAPAGDDPGAQVDKAAELQAKWGTATGQLWQLGEHRLVCGDCTDAAVVAAVAFGDRIDLWVSDPPYGVSYADKNKYLNSVAFGNRIQTPIINDDLTLDEATDLWRKAFGVVFEIAKPGCVYYVNAPQGGDLMMMMMMLRESGWLLKPQIIWVKNNHVLGRSDYQLKHEPILYGWKEGAHFWIGSRSEMSVWQVDKPQNSDFHPTTKPVELMEKAIQNSSKPGEIVFDGFLGSGTTLIACERLGRRCRACEIDAGYVAVALERWHVMTGKTPVLVEV